MRYREAKLLKEGDPVVAKKTGTSYTVKSVEVYGSVSCVRINCEGVSFLNSELEERE